MDTSPLTIIENKPVQVTPPAPAPLSLGKSVSLKELITSEDTDNALACLRSIMNDENAPKSLRIQAADSLLDRKHGKATQFTEQTVKLVTYQDLLGTIREKEAKLQEVVEAYTVEVEPDDAAWAALL